MTDKERVASLRLQLREARGPSLWERATVLLGGEGAFKVKVLAFLAAVALGVAWFVHLALTRHLDVVGLMLAYFIPFALLLAAVVSLALVLTYAVVYIRNSDCFDRHNATREARAIRDRLGTADEKLGDPAAVAEMYAANTRFIILLIAVSILSFMGFVAVAAFARLV